MDICLAYKRLNEDLVNIAKSLYVVEEKKEEKKEVQLRIVETPVEVTKETFRCCQVISAHNIQQYKNKLYVIRLKEDMSSWLDLLLQIDKGEEYDVT